MKKIMSLLLSVAMVLSLVACGGSDSGSNPGTGGSSTPSGENTTGSTKDTLVIAMSSEPSTLNTLVADDFAAWSITNNIYDSLIEFHTDGSLTPGLAESWDYSEDGTEITFHLRQGVKFHDGSAMTADDVVFTYEQVIPYAAAQNVNSAMKSMEKGDDYTVKLTLLHPFGPVEYCAGSSQFSIVCKSAYEKDPDAFTRNPVGTGAYKLSSWESGDKITLERFDEYWNGAPALKTVTYKIIPDSTTQAIALENGEIDLLEGVSMADRQHIIDTPSLGYVEGASASTYFISMNNKEGPFANRDLRLAVSYAVNRQEFIDGAMNGVGSPCETPMSPITQGWPSDFKNNEQNLEKAKEHLAAAGYPDGVTVTLKCMESAAYSKPAEILQEQLRQIGITVNIEKMERAKFLQEMRDDKQYEISIMSATAFYPDADYIYALYHTDATGGAGRNYHCNSNPELDEMLETARTSNDQAQREQLYRDICQFMKEEAITIPLYVPMNGSAYNIKLQGVIANPSRRLYLKDLSWTE